MKLYLVPTPIGNLEDITLRALRILRDEVDTILAEDTRTSGNLLKHYNISKRMQAFHLNNEHQQVGALAERIAAGERMALVTDAGTPAISDPGFLISRECRRLGIEVETLPGATAFVPALVNSGLPCDRFCFEGFLPQKKGRATRLAQLAEEERTMIFYESPMRLAKTLKQLAEQFGGDRQASVSREISKLHNSTHNGSLDELAQYFTDNEPRGEIVIVVAGKAPAENVKIDKYAHFKQQNKTNDLL